jgi:hypothetical protein
MQQPPLVPVTPTEDLAKGDGMIDSRLVGKWVNRWESWHSIEFDADWSYKEVQWFGTTLGKFRYSERGFIEVESPGIFEPNIDKLSYRIDGDILTLKNGLFSMRKSK